MRKYRFLIFLIAIIFVGAIADPFGLLSPVKNYTYILFSPITNSLSQTAQGTQTFFHTLFSLGNILKENTSLKNENINLKSDKIKTKEIERENSILKEELKFAKSTQLQLISANIIAKSPGGLTDSVIINKGSKDGIRENQAVVSQGFLIGRIKTVNKNSSEIVLIVSNTSKVPTFLQDSRGNGIMQGGLKGLIMDDIQLDIIPKKGEAVLTSNIGNILPSGIPIGNVKEINFSQNEISRSVLIESPISFSHLEMVFVAK